MPEGIYPGRHHRRHHSRAAQHVLRVLSLGAWALLTSGCDLPPPPRQAERPSVLSSTPGNGDEGVPRLGVFYAFVDRRLLSRTVNPGTVRLRSGDISQRLSVWFDPLDLVIIATNFDESPLEPEVVYRFVIDGIRDLEDHQIRTEYVARFRTGTEIGEPFVPPTADWEAVEPLLTARCAVEGCHVGPLASLGLDLSSPEAIQTTAIGRRSVRLGGTTGSDASRGSVFLGALHIIDVVGGVGRPDGSLLIYKALGDPHVLGERMPPPSHGPPLSHDEIAMLSAWILGGAETP